MFGRAVGVFAANAMQLIKLTVGELAATTAVLLIGTALVVAGRKTKAKDRPVTR